MYFTKPKQRNPLRSYHLCVLYNVPIPVPCRNHKSFFVWLGGRSQTKTEAANCNTENTTRSSSDFIEESGTSAQSRGLMSIQEQLNSISDSRVKLIVNCRWVFVVPLLLQNNVVSRQPTTTLRLTRSVESCGFLRSIIYWQSLYVKTTS